MKQQLKAIAEEFVKNPPEYGTDEHEQTLNEMHRLGEELKLITDEVEEYFLKATDIEAAQKYLDLLAA